MKENPPPKISKHAFPPGGSARFGHFPIRAQRLEILFLVKMGSDLGEPFGQEGHVAAHVLATGKHELVEEHPLRVDFEQRAAWVQVHRHPVFHRAVAIAPPLQSRRVGEEARRQGFLDGYQLVGTHGRDADFDPVA